MGSLKGKILIIGMLVFFTGCRDNNKTEIETICGFKVSDKIILSSQDEKWDDWQGDGNKTVVYDITNVNYFEQKIKGNSKFIPYDLTDPNDIHFRYYQEAKDDLSKLLKNGSGYYRYLEDKNVSRKIMIDLKNKKLIYSYTII